ncbi:unnamed protein product, partial [Discosporangium mesarthrocarpum]
MSAVETTASDFFMFPLPPPRMSGSSSVASSVTFSRQGSRESMSTTSPMSPAGLTSILGSRRNNPRAEALGARSGTTARPWALVQSTKSSPARPRTPDIPAPRVRRLSTGRLLPPPGPRGPSSSSSPAPAAFPPSGRRGGPSGSGGTMHPHPVSRGTPGPQPRAQGYGSLSPSHHRRGRGFSAGNLSPPEEGSAFWQGDRKGPRASPRLGARPRASPGLGSGPRASPGPALGPRGRSGRRASTGAGPARSDSRLGETLRA